MKRKVIRNVILALLVIFILLQFIRPEKNTGNAHTPTDITKHVSVPDTIMGILQRSCYDCHSNHTKYPWYSEISPASLWLANHIKEGKEELNFSEFSQYSRRRMKSKLSGVAEQVEKREMPLDSYLWIHSGARLSDNEIKMIRIWADSAKSELDQKKS